MGSAAPLPASAISRSSLVSTANPQLDSLLRGGIPVGSFAVLEGKIGRFSLLTPLLARVTQRHLAAIIDNGELYPPGLAQAGVHLEHLLVVSTSIPLEIARAVDTLLRSRSCAVIVMPAVSLRTTVWTRLTHLAQRSNSLVFVLAPQRTLLTGHHFAPLSIVPATVRLNCSVERFSMHGTVGPSRFCTGYDIHVTLAKHRYVPTTSAIVRAS